MDIEISNGLIAAAEVAADHYRDEQEYFEREGEQETAASFASLEQGLRELIARATDALEIPSASSDPLVARIEQLLDEDDTGTLSDLLWDYVEGLDVPAIEPRGLEG